ncbi:hypothetical protein NKZ03_25980 [Sinorhizobium meliloti]|uniref:hypothetical protein n=1 Tax=Rhizobium meliloti TaxID=382 RepID=UPI003D650666
MAGEIQAAFDAVYADGPSTSPDEPDKNRIRTEVGGTIQGQVDSVRNLATNGAQPKEAVRAASLTNVTLSSVVNGSSFGGVTVATGDRIAPIGQTSGATNGIYVVQAATAPARAADADSSDEVFRMSFYVKEGTNAGKSYVCTNATAPTLGATALVFALSSDTSSLNATLAGKADQTALNATNASLQAEVDERSDLIDNELGDLWADALVDQNGNVVEGTTTDGTKHVVALSVGGKHDISADDDNLYTEASIDDEGNIVESLSPDGTRRFTALALGSDVHVSTQDIPGYREVHIDEEGNIVYALLDSGEALSVGADDGVPETTFSLIPGFGTEIVMAPSYGQSWAHGTSGQPAITLVQRFNSLMFNGGVRPRIDGESNDPSVVMSSLVPLVESDAPGGTQGETPVSGFCEAAIERVAAENGIVYTDHQYQFFGVAPAQGGQPIGNLSKGTSTYAYLMQCVTEGYARAQELGKTFSVPAVHWWQGEGDYALGPVSFDYYLGALKKLRADIDADVRAIVPDHPPVVLIVNQSLSHGVKGQPVPSVDLAMVQASIDDPYIVLAGPMYAYPAADNGHYTAQGYKHMGAVAGVAYKRTVIDGEKWESLRPINMVAQGNFAVIQFHVPKGPLVLDTVAIADPGDYGFTAVGQAGEARDITSVSLIGSDRVKIVADGPIGKVRYAWTGGSFTGPLVGPRGCLRDSQGDAIKLDPTGLNLPLHNWCVLFEI